MSGIGEKTLHDLIGVVASELESGEIGHTKSADGMSQHRPPQPHYGEEVDGSKSRRL